MDSTMRNVGANCPTTAAAASILADLQPSTANSSSGQMQVLSYMSNVVKDFPGVNRCSCVCYLTVHSCPEECLKEWIPHRDTAGRQICELCSRQLAKVKYTHPHNHGDACHPRCKPRKQSSTTAANPTHATTPAVSRPRKRQRSESDPGKTINLTLLRIRAPRTTIIPLVKRARVQAPSVDITSLLDQTHTRRMAMLHVESTVMSRRSI